MILKILITLIGISLLNTATDQEENGLSREFTIENPYSVKKKHEWRASLHNHSRFEPNYTHAPVPTPERLTEYRDAKVSPPYGVVVITEHGRITLPGNTDPKGQEPQWGVEGILFIPGIEGTIGKRAEDWKTKKAGDDYPADSDCGKLFGEICCIGVSKECGDVNDRDSFRHRCRNEWKASEKLMQIIKDGVFVVLCHPNCESNYSGYTYDELDLIFGNPEKRLKGLSDLPQALEIGNSGVDFDSRSEYKNAEEKWDYLLSRGHHLWGTASEDAHGHDSFEGWVVVYMDELNQDEFLKSLKSGNFYASQGPLIKDIQLDGKTITLKTDKPSLIEFIGKNGKVLKSENDVNQSSYNVNGSELYVRGRVTREFSVARRIKGGIGTKRSAWTNPFFIVLNDREI